MQLQFNATAVQPSQPMEPVPEGWYPVVVKTFEPKETKAKDGSWMLAGELEIIDGQYRGRKLFLNLNIGNKNPQAVEIAYRELSAICHVTGRHVINDSSELCNIPFQVKATVEGSNNRISGYKDMQGNDPGKAGAPGSVPQAAAPVALPPAPASAPQQPWAAPAPAPAAAWQAPAPAAGAAPWGAPAPAAAQPQAPAAWTPPAQGGAPAGAAPWARS